LHKQDTIIFRRDAYWKVGGLDESLHYAMDWDLLLKLGKVGKVVLIPDPWQIYAIIQRTRRILEVESECGRLHALRKLITERLIAITFPSKSETLWQSKNY
jgi:hypothetical protein